MSSINSPTLTRLTTSVRRVLLRRRPWLELLDPSAVSRPISLASAAVRLRKNAAYFRVNYLIVLSAVAAVSLLSHPLSLLALLSLAATWLFLYFLRPSDQPLVILNRTFSDREALWALVGVTVFVVFLTDVVSVLAWAGLVGVGIVCVHGAVRDPEDLFLDDDQDLSGNGVFSFVGNGAGSFAAAPPPLASEV